MRKTLLLTSLLFCALWLVAQTDPNQTLAPDRGTKTGNDQITVEGCLNETSGNYTLTDSSGTVIRLAGASAKTGEYVGHTVKITGTNPSRVPRTVSESSSGEVSVSLPTRIVTSVEDVSNSCSGNP